MWETAGHVHTSRREAEKAWVGASRQGTVPSCRKIGALEGFREEVAFELSFEGRGGNLLGFREGSGTCVLSRGERGWEPPS